MHPICMLCDASLNYRVNKLSGNFKRHTNRNTGLHQFVHIRKYAFLKRFPTAVFHLGPPRFRQSKSTWKRHISSTVDIDNGFTPQSTHPRCVAVCSKDDHTQDPTGKHVPMLSSAYPSCYIQEDHPYIEDSHNNSIRPEP